MAWGMWRARYWAVLGFQLILVLLIFSAVFGLAAQAASVAQIIATLALLAVSGTFFWFMVKAMARIQMPTRDVNESLRSHSRVSRTGALYRLDSWRIPST